MRFTRRRLVALSGLLTFLVLGMPGTSSGLPGADSQGQISAVKTKPGQVQFVLSTGDLRLQNALNPAAMRVTINGVATPATGTAARIAATPGTAPARDVILTLDISGSMAGTGIAAARAAVISYADHLPADVRVGLVTFSNTANILLAPTTDRSALRTAVDTVQAGGTTALYDGVISAAGALRALPHDAIRRLLILSDGNDTSSTRTQADVARILASEGIAADVVAFRLPGDQAVLSQIAAASQGRVLPAASAGDLATAFANAAQVFNQQVLVTVKVPDAVAGKTAKLGVSLNVGGRLVSAYSQVTLPTASGTPAIRPMPSVRHPGESEPLASQPLAEASTRTLWLVCGLVFVVIFTIASVGLYAPMTAGVRAERQSRLAEVGRYRLVDAPGRSDSVVVAAPAENKLAKRTLGYADRAVRARGQRERFISELDRAGMRIRPEEWVVLEVCVAVILGALGAVLTHSVIGLVIGAVLGWIACRLFIRRKIGSRKSAFEDQLPDTLQLVAGSLRSGFSLNQALVSVVREGTEPAASEFSRALAEIRLGAELDDALDSVGDRMQSQDLHWVVMAVRISREVGGNLAEVLQNTVVTMRERAQLRGLVKVLSAEGRMSAKVLISLPFVLGGYLLAFKPAYLLPLVSTGVGIVMLIAGTALLSLGAFWLSRIVKIEV